MMKSWIVAAVIVLASLQADAHRWTPRYNMNEKDFVHDCRMHNNGDSPGVEKTCDEIWKEYHHK